MVKTNTIQISQDILVLISEIDEFKGAWRALGTLAPERLSALRHVATIESIGSSTRIEGSKLSDRDVEHLLSSLQIKSFETRDEQEVGGYAEAMELVFQSWDQITITENHIKRLHRDLLKYSTKDEHHRGAYKTNSNSVAAFDEDGKQIGIVFKTATPFDTPRLMHELVAFASEAFETRKMHPLLIIGVFVVVFLEIHPFQDGNGRLSRVLTTLLLLRSGYSYVPYSSMESVIEQSKEAYYLALRQTQGSIRTDTPNWQPWMLFFLRALQAQMKRLAKKVERERIVLAVLPELSVQILEFAREHGRVTIGDVTKLTGVNRNTLKKALQPARRQRPFSASWQRSGRMVCAVIASVTAVEIGLRLPIRHRLPALQCLKKRVRNSQDTRPFLGKTAEQSSPLYCYPPSEITCHQLFDSQRHQPMLRQNDSAFSFQSAFKNLAKPVPNTVRWPRSLAPGLLVPTTQIVNADENFS